MADTETSRERAATVIASGGIIAFRTDTFYGLGVDPFNQAAIERLKTLKGRDDRKPILVVISDRVIVERFIVEKSEIFDAVCREHWPGPLTIVMRAKPEVPESLTAGSGTIGLRLPDDEMVRSLARACGGALTATSANLAGREAARSAEDVALSFPVGLDLIIDGGTVSLEKPSTVIDLSGSHVKLIREGAVTRSELSATLNKHGMNYPRIHTNQHE